MSSEIKVIEARKIYEGLDFIRRRPEIFLTSKSIMALQNFVNGYMIMAGVTNDIDHPCEPNIDNFKYWILSKDKIHGKIGNSYSTVLLNECNGNEENAFDKFFEYLDEFKREQMNK